MKTRMTIGIAIFILACTFGSVGQSTAYANIYCEIVSPIGIEKSTDLTISQTIINQKGASVALNANKTGNGTLASFSIKGNNQLTFDVTLPKEVFTINNGEGNMLVSNFTASSAPTSYQQERVISVGATLNVNGTQAAGNFSAQNPFQVTLNYN